MNGMYRVGFLKKHSFSPIAVYKIVNCNPCNHVFKPNWRKYPAWCHLGSMWTRGATVIISVGMCPWRWIPPAEKTSLRKMSLLFEVADVLRCSSADSYVMHTWCEVFAPQRLRCLRFCDPLRIWGMTQWVNNTTLITACLPLLSTGNPHSLTLKWKVN